MTLVTIDLSNVASETKPGDKVVFWAPHLREGTTTAQEEVTLVDGLGEVELKPGPVMVHIRAHGVVDTGPRLVTVPDEGPVDLDDLLRQTFTYTPEVVTEVARDAAAAAAAADRAESVAASVHWQDDRLSVMGVLGPSLRGPKGDPGDPGGGAGDVLWSELNPVLDGKAPVSHVHTISQVSGLRDELDGKASSGHSHTVASITGLQDELDGKAAADHQHVWGDVTGKPDVYPPESHSHPQSEVDGLEAALAGKASADHTHSQYAESSRVTALEDSQPIIVSSLPSSPLPGRIYLVTG